MDNKINFLWGAATSSHQVEGGNFLNDWYEWERLGRVKEKSALACDHYNRYKQDFKIAHSLGHNAHRFSLEWSRLEPEEGRWDRVEWEHYRDAARTLRSLGIEPIVTLNHFTLPLWLYKRGGWLHKSSASSFEAFAKKAVENLGEDVAYWITLNEPFVYAYMAYVKGLWPPGRQDFKEAFRVIENQAHAHANAFRIMHELAAKRSSRKIMIGLALSVSPFFPCKNRSLKDILATRLRYTLYNHMFVRSVLNGFIFFPGFRIQALSARRALDFLGLNYYTYDYIKYKGLARYDIFGEPCYLAHHDKKEEKRNSLGWRIYPEGLYLLLKDFGRYRLPTIITENGICTDEDADRSRFIKEHLFYTFKAKAEGAPVAGYLYWSLLDNFEWADGYRPRFGLVEVNYDTRLRTVRPSAHLMRDYIKEGLKQLSY